MRKATIPLLLLAAFAAAGCQSFNEAAGLTKKSPDEFAVTTKAPLVIPPDFNLRPPSPGAAPLNASDPATAAQVAMFSATDTASIAANLPGSYSPGERMLLANAGVQNSDPAIRQQLQSDRPGMQSADPSFVARLLGTPASSASGMITAAPPPKPAPAARPAPAPKKSSGGWFGWLF